MTKRDFLDKLKTKGDLKSQTEAAEMLDTVLDTIKDVLNEGGDISIQGFGSFKVVDVKEKSGKIPGSDKTYTKAAHKAPKFTFAKGVKETVA